MSKPRNGWVTKLEDPERGIHRTQLGESRFSVIWDADHGLYRIDITGMGALGAMRWQRTGVYTATELQAMLLCEQLYGTVGAEKTRQIIHPVYPREAANG